MRITSGNKDLDDFLGGGYEKDIVTAIYGPAGSGKTNLLLICAAAQKTGTILWLDTEGGFSLERFKQVNPDFEDSLNRITFFKPTTFADQRKAIDAIRLMASKNTALIVVDSIGALYRLELSKAKDPYLPSRALGLQLSYLVEIARRDQIPVIITTQVYPDFNNKETTKIVGGEIVKYSCKCLIELEKTKEKTLFHLRKSRALPPKTGSFTITQEGIAFAKNS